MTFPRQGAENSAEQNMQNKIQNVCREKSNKIHEHAQNILQHMRKYVKNTPKVRQKVVIPTYLDEISRMDTISPNNFQYYCQNGQNFGKSCYRKP